MQRLASCTSLCEQPDLVHVVLVHACVRQPWIQVLAPLAEVPHPVVLGDDVVQRLMPSRISCVRELDPLLQHLVCDLEDSLALLHGDEQLVFVVVEDVLDLELRV